MIDSPRWKFRGFEYPRGLLGCGMTRVQENGCGEEVFIPTASCQDIQFRRKAVTVCVARSALVSTLLWWTDLVRGLLKNFCCGADRVIVREVFCHISNYM